jgi:hypothetical protein
VRHLGHQARAAREGLPELGHDRPAAFENALALQTAIGNIKPGAVTYAEMVDPTFAQKLGKS